MNTLKQPWAIKTEEVIVGLQTTNNGLSEEEALARLKQYGSNTFHSREKKSVFMIFLKQFSSPLIFLLIGASILSLILGEWIDTGVILFAVLINISVGFYHEYNAESTLSKLSTYIKDRARVIRDGKEEEIDSSLLVPGDIIKISYGTRIPADARILTLNNLRVDEAILTGESLPIEKKEEVIELTSAIADQKNIAHAGTLVVEGYATAIVFATGNNTEIGKIAGIVSKINRTETPLQRGVSKLAWFIFIIVMFIVVIILVLGITRGEPLVPMLLLSSAVAVGAVPEALPIVLTMILAIGAMRIASKKGIIRKLTAAETLGSTTIILTDKTGTLTLADMQLKGLHTFSSILSEESKTGDNINQHLSLEQKKLLEYAILNTDVSVENPQADEKNWSFRGRPFEVNIVKSAILHHLPINNITQNSSMVVLPFNSTNKFSVAESGDKYIVMGAPDILLKKSKISKEDYLKIEKWIEETSRGGKRIIGLAHFSRNENENFNISKVLDLEFLGMLTFYDPIRPEVPQAIKNIESHGMKMVLVTGDLVGTALAVSKELGWEVNEEQVITGNELRVLSEEELIALVPKIKIFARVTPEDKLRIGKAYQSTGEIVAMTGDGVNDAPALKAMDIGISLGSGSDVAKAAADLVLLDDNFETISLAIDEGRKILSNIRKSFVYLMSNSLDEVFVIGGSLLLALPLPITALQIIWVNLFTGSLPALAFAFEENTDKEKYVGHDLGLIFTKEVKVLTFGIGVLSSLFLFLLYYFLLKTGLELHVVRSIFFVCFSSYILVITFSFRSLRRSILSYNPFTNKKLNIAILISVFLLFFTMTVPFMRNIFEIAPLPLSWIPFIFLWLILNIVLVEGAKYMMHTHGHLLHKLPHFNFSFLKNK
ncbi:MAG: cation-transporting P-type ATPase [Candidatus Pacebacteria bacterium]|nr:cation-transporting P-type ATPase [Candidatus Paceibacterota bacterium]